MNRKMSKQCKCDWNSRDSRHGAYRYLQNFWHCSRQILAEILHRYAYTDRAWPNIPLGQRYPECPTDMFHHLKIQWKMMMIILLSFQIRWDLYHSKETNFLTWQTDQCITIDAISLFAEARNQLFFLTYNHLLSVWVFDLRDERRIENIH